MNHAIKAKPGTWTETHDAARDAESRRPLDHSRVHRVGRYFARSLDHACIELPDEVARRLAFARERALTQANNRRPGTQAPTVRLDSGKTRWLGLPSWLQRWSHLLPAIALFLGLLATSQLIEKRHVQAAAAIDAELLNDDLPPEAFTDPGFLEFLRQGQPAELAVATSEPSEPNPVAPR